MNNLNVFSGSNSVLDFLDPGKNPPTPLVEIPRSLNPYWDDDVRIFAKLMHHNGLGNVKLLPAFNMLTSLKDKNQIKSIHSLIENSSGNTVFSLAVIGRLFGIPTTKAFVSHEVTPGKLQLLRFLGTQVIVNEEPICPDPEDKESGIYKAKQLAQRKGWINPGQYDNEENPKAHFKWTGPQIWKQTDGKISVLSAGLGTAGTMVGTGGYLKSKNKNVVNLGVVRLPNNPVPGVRTPNLLRQIAFDWKKVVDETEEVGTVESFKKSLELCRLGLMVGPSSGFALQGLLQYLDKQKKAGKLQKLKNSDGEIVCVFICCDGPLPYLNEYFEYLAESEFPKIENKELLINSPDAISRGKNKIDTYEIDVTQAMEQIYSQSKTQLWTSIKQGKDAHLRDDTIILDVRAADEYQDAHLPSSINIDHKDALKDVKNLADKLRAKKVYLICRSGLRSELVAEALRQRQIDAYNIRGGMIGWSRLNYPRVRPEYCMGKPCLT